ncbi:MAG: hypothetical protein CO150_01985 [Nitrospirae bacterium CG_4_9_14_3_um_filter_53_35]|nr:MAG: hypothetical protein AUK29_03420 [Nitrospirae bacterium CG2_30_53_67]PIS36809.1 MAG: hypothetical protein COT35_09270 [Nitrospirae bacterium CG08_land_8_20_14_0_20_52_24]PIV82820.1 MAG: hypothetical protein COW52_11640 [Nitrospirae bacterium CG17_big_fil_post_rev_8_21_14_2_50_50_9]PIW86231.1 MAG: hypothetical protein COZ95_00380 [Nitrospirae bacterium CG_4_8_14_3_um_filter_50_41]PIX85284.1 MAG: hypothetical protein COZ32_09310 [Nitrospirae bacterium CG_4_10_14_3_um_filter_53_41]PJA7716
MESKMDYGKLWTGLETAVRRYQDRLPVDDFLPDPEEQVSRLMQERMKRRRPLVREEDPSSQIQDEPLQGMVDQAEIGGPQHPLNEKRDIEKELRSRFSGNSFAELEDV